MVAKYSKDLVFDGLLYDAIIIVVYNLSVIIISKRYDILGPVNWVGILLVIMGLILFRVKI